MVASKPGRKRPETPWEEGGVAEPAEIELTGARDLRPEQLAANLKRARRAMGLSPEELAARTGLRLVSIQAYESGKVWPPLVHGQILADALATRIPVLLGMETPLGQTPPRNGSVSPELLAVMTEQAEAIATLKRTLEITQASEKRWMGLAEAVTEGVLLHDGKTVRDVNPRFAEVFGYDRAAVIGRPIMEFVAPESRPIVAKAVRTGTTAVYEMLGLRSDGTTVRLLVAPRRMASGMRIAAFRIVAPAAL